MEVQVKATGLSAQNLIPLIRAYDEMDEPEKNYLLGFAQGMRTNADIAAAKRHDKTNKE